MITEKLKLISVNTGYCETTNLWVASRRRRDFGVCVFSFLYLNQSDPDGTLRWLVDELYEAETRGIVVHIMAHIPPGGEKTCSMSFKLRLYAFYFTYF